ncbi:MAG: hypothetical protein CEN88_251 [Candidatus Berkelbacteria bacterium Licking1014_2]|uniref:DNA alkylation repair enzyme n=1 Tax=Candidatus Berkelbacteria bacterium Licking1014_2 TaxID=2017146 RepID=A0A554LVM4_9BACT|nr:MAG: hypothetical protein CEN88_251 [Candidatus Berkelbacteria bacterium Licking1014_2]
MKINDQVINELKRFSSPAKAQILQRFFKTGKGEYGEGDVFLGVAMPDIRKTVKKYWQETKLEEAKKLLPAKYHEIRSCALLILVERYKKIESERGRIYRVYITNTKYINNWDLVDLTAGHIVGAYLEDKPKDLLYMFARSKDLWQRRIAILATFYYIYKGEAKETIKIAKMLLRDKHDLIHKAVGWMLREVGKRCGEKILTDFLDQQAKIMPRTMLRYAIEKLDRKKQLFYLK